MHLYILLYILKNYKLDTLKYKLISQGITEK